MLSLACYINQAVQVANTCDHSNGISGGILQVGGAWCKHALGNMHQTLFLGQEGGLASFKSKSCHSLMTMTLNYACTETAKCTEASVFASTF